MIDTEQMHDRGVQIMNMHAIGGDVVTKLICSSVHRSWPDSTASHPDTEAARLMIASEVGLRSP